MKVSKLKALMKKSRNCTIYQVSDKQFIQNEHALYVADELPRYTKNSWLADLDVPMQNRRQWKVTVNNDCPNINVNDTDDTEIPLKPALCDIVVNGQNYRVFEISNGVMIIDTALLAPVTDGDIWYFERTGKEGRTYLAIKYGLFFQAAIMPCFPTSESYLHRLQLATNLCMEKIENSKLQDTEHQQVGFTVDDETGEVTEDEG